MFSLLIFSIIFTNGIISLEAQSNGPSPAPNGPSENLFGVSFPQPEAAASALSLGPNRGYGTCRYEGIIEHCDTSCLQYFSRIRFSTRGCDSCVCDSPNSRHCDVSRCLRQEPRKAPTFEELLKEFHDNDKNWGCKLVQVEKKFYRMCPYEASRKSNNDVPFFPSNYVVPEPDYSLFPSLLQPSFPW
ncbi:uncharacterized protein LOC123292631 [Chrysoperla carnea]|uniref:uncharacterized protein LOC123292631 n=1 Tax=Chrysoperla carnea TaxID=189513 RepID=UPI001D07B060|nr:uncharacterized protein LOC123292631 [Chrysoperla carnea]